MRSKHTGIVKRAKTLARQPALAAQTMRPLSGITSANFPRITNAEYILLIEWTGRQLHPGKRGRISVAEPPALPKLGLVAAHWTMKVKASAEG